MNTAGIVIVGGGHAAAQLCASLVERGAGPEVTLVCGEAELPYQRPPLSKAGLLTGAAPTPLRPAAWYAQHGIRTVLGDGALAIDRAGGSVTLESGRELRYRQLVLALGARARGLPGLPARLANVATLRGAADAGRLRALLGASRHLSVLGGGFIGLEVAAAARAQGLAVTVYEGGPRVLARAVSPVVSAHLQAWHAAQGTAIVCGARVDGFEVAGGRLAAWHVNGVRTPVDAVLLALGAEPNTALAGHAGLALAPDGGVAVDAWLRSSDPRIWAIGDCASFPAHAHTPAAPARWRLESVQNAQDQARTLAANLLGFSERYAALPWFWSEQGALRLQITGLRAGDETAEMHPGEAAGAWSLLHHAPGGALRCAESLNDARTHLAARQCIARGAHWPPDSGRAPAPEAAAAAVSAPRPSAPLVAT